MHGSTKRSKAPANQPKRRIERVSGLAGLDKRYYCFHRFTYEGTYHGDLFPANQITERGTQLKASYKKLVEDGTPDLIPHDRIPTTLCVLKSAYMEHGHSPPVLNLGLGTRLLEMNKATGDTREIARHVRTGDPALAELRQKMRNWREFLDKEGDCPVCLENLGELDPGGGSYPIRLPCGHALCRSCLMSMRDANEWGGAVDEKCPLCRQCIPSDVQTGGKRHKKRRSTRKASHRLHVRSRTARRARRRTRSRRMGKRRTRHRRR